MTRHGRQQFSTATCFCASQAKRTLKQINGFHLKATTVDLASVGNYPVQPKGYPRGFVSKQSGWGLQSQAGPDGERGNTESKLLGNPSVNFF